MATLNTLRTRFGVVLSAVIAFALLAFVFSLKSEMGFSGNEPIVAKINGENITITEYQNEYNKVQRMSGVDGSDEQQSNMLFAQTWQMLFSKYALQPALINIGIEVSDSERMEIIQGVIPTQTMYSAFANPATGAYDSNSVNSFLLSSQGNPEAEGVWATLSEQALGERMTTKFAQLVAASTYVNKLEIESGVKAANNNYAGRWVARRYSKVADSLVAVSSAEIKRYYDAHKSSYKRQPTRTISYVEFKIEPSAEDLTALESSAKSLASEFAESDDIRAFIRGNRNGSISQNYFTAAELPAAEAAKLTAGETYGAVQVGDNWRASRVFKSVVAPDTLSLRHIVLSYQDRDLADSLLVALRKGGDFAEAATTYSGYTESAQRGGDLGEVPFSAFTEEFASKLSTAKKGDIVEIESGDMIQLVEVYGTGKRVKHYMIASLEIPIVPSDATRRAAHNAAGLFVSSAKSASDAESFKAAATESKVMPRTANLISATRTINSIAGSQEVARWAHRAEVAELSEIFKVDEGYVVAILTEINDSEHRSLSEVEGTIKRKLMNDKKFEILKAEVNASSLDTQAEAWGETVADFDGVNFGSTFISGLGAEPRVVGAIASTPNTGVLSAPIKGNNALYLFEVTEVTKAEEPQSAEEERVRAESIVANSIQQMLFVAVASLTDVEDMRGAAL